VRGGDSYADVTPLREARAAYFRSNGFGEDGRYGEAWVRVKLGPMTVWFPNTDGRRRAVGLHDLHHVATGYQTTLAGEAEISAWEIGAGCADYYTAWLLNLGGMAMGLVVAPRRMWRAFRRGRRSNSLYRIGLDERWLEETVGDLRRRLGV